MSAQQERQPGFVHTGSGRVVYDTGKLLIGLRAPRRVSLPAMSADAEAIQSALLATDEPEHPVDRLLRRWGWLVAIGVVALIAAGVL